MSARSTIPRFVRGWPMLAALGAGLVLIATAAGALDATGRASGVGGGAGAGGIVAAAVLVGCGVAAFGWAVVALHAGRLVAPRAALAVSLGLVGASAMLLATGTGPSLGVAVLPLLAGAAFALVVSAGAAARLRGGRRRRTGVPRGGSVIGMVIGAALVAALATPALAATAAGELAVPHGELHDPGHRHAGR
ncbi:hypothetical protein MUN74_07305 [Agromyces endophyticus]|uniref:hypothetical protein n=1 Tax=Agromyces sp. H17E-10 TaxID=2932244 RepID=UPI001FD5FDE5|nr:hypothetical protein [Agromyces sp. H17E-10]UOQ90704.1 hypothetical protein MUN74_07305 [Agromyces sp. H17E-10]